MERLVAGAMQHRASETIVSAVQYCAVTDPATHQIVPNSARGRSFSVPVSSLNALTS